MRSGSKLFVAAIALLLAIGFVACGGDDGGEASTAAETQTTAAPDDERIRGGEASIEDFGSEAEGSEREELLATFTGYLNAIADKDYAAACSHLATLVQRSLQEFAAQIGTAGGCAAILPKLIAADAGEIAREQASGEVTKVRVEDDRAFIVFHAPGAELYQLSLIEEDGEWKAATATAGVLVPEL